MTFGAVPRKTIICICLLFPVLLSCGTRPGKDDPILTEEDTHLKIRGELLTRKYCTGCHISAEPKLLDRTSWVSVLSQMQVQMSKSGIEINEAEWDTVWAYYRRFSDVVLEDGPKDRIRSSAAEFSGEASLIADPARPNITLLSVRRGDGSLFIGDASSKLYWLRDNVIHRTYELESTPIDIFFDSDGQRAYVLCIGSLRPSEQRTGQLLRLDLETAKAVVLIDTLDRPVDFEMCDLDQDGNLEFLISCFGSTLGKVNTGGIVHAEESNDVWVSKDFKLLPGASKAIAEDLNGDGRPDVLAMFAQGQESIVRFMNTGVGFREETVMNFPPVYGVTDMILADLDDDGDSDLIVANGDNGDFSPVFKPYHGVRIYRNSGGAVFEDWMFQPIHGAARVQSRDFDLDGDIDIAVLSIYPDLARYPEETLVYLENENGTFKPKHVRKEPSVRWVILEAGDIDHDGDDDLVAGANLILSFPIPASYSERFRNAKNSITVFENVTK